jgi:hypothetical protein
MLLMIEVLEGLMQTEPCSYCDGSGFHEPPKVLSYRKYLCSRCWGTGRLPKSSIPVGTLLRLSKHIYRVTAQHTLTQQTKNVRKQNDGLLVNY